MANERIDEFKGSVKEGAGKVTGNERMEAEGRGEKEMAKAERNVKGAANQVKGGVEQTIGKLTGDEETRAEGKFDSAKGDAQRTG